MTPYQFESARAKSGYYLVGDVSTLEGPVAPLNVSLVDPKDTHPAHLWKLWLCSSIFLYLGVDRKNELYSMVSCNSDDINFVQHLSGIKIEHPAGMNGDFRIADEELAQGIVRRFSKHQPSLKTDSRRDILDWFCRPEGRKAFRVELNLDAKKKAVLD